MSLERATGSADKHIVCRNCAHGKHFHNESGCFVDDEWGGPDCDCEAWDYGVNVVEVGSERNEE